jgi:hypothetical protein
MSEPITRCIYCGAWMLFTQESCLTCSKINHQTEKGNGYAESNQRGQIMVGKSETGKQV